MMNTKSEASIALDEEGGLLFDDATREKGRANLNAKALAAEYPFFVFADGSVIESDPMACTNKATPAGHWGPEKIQSFRKKIHEGQIPAPPMLFRVTEQIKSMLPTFSFPGSLKSQMHALLQNQLNLMPAPRILERSRSLAAPVKDGWMAMIAEAEEPIQLHHVLDAQGVYGMESVQLPALNNLVRTKTIPNFCLDITDVAGLSISKSELGIYKSFEELATSQSPELLQDATLEGLQALLEHRDFPILAHPHRKESYEANLTDGRVYLNNCDGSHHFAAARTIASRLNTPVPLQATMEFTYIDIAALVQLRLGFEMYLISMTWEFRDTMARSGAPFCSRPLRSVHGIDNPTVILLPKSAPTTKTVAGTLSKLGYQDLGLHLARLAPGQNAIESHLMNVREINRSKLAQYEDPQESTAPSPVG